MKIGILQTGHLVPELRRKHGDHDALFRRFLGGRGFEFTTYVVVNREMPDAPDAEDGWIITGSSAGAYEQHDWIPPLEAFLRQAYDAGVPIFGVCFGHQILAQALGGKVEKFKGGWSAGPQSYDSDRFGAQQIIAWHQDQVTEVPEGARVVGSSSFCANAILDYGNRALSIQPHPEFEAEYFADMYDARAHVLPLPVRDQVTKAIGKPLTNAAIADEVERFFKQTEALQS